MNAPVAVVTGAGSGIGREVARALLAHGYRVALAGRTRETLDETAADADHTLAWPTDVTDEGSVEQLFAAVESRWDRVDLLFNNAGAFGPSADIDEVDVDAWRQLVDVNLTGSFLCARAAFGMMKRQQPRGGRIINNGSISAHVPRPQSVAYTATKHAITGLTRSLALDGRPYRIACGQIDIGNAETALIARVAQGARQADGSIRPEPLFDPRHVADAVLYLADLPLDVNVPFMTVMASGMPYLGRG